MHVEMNYQVRPDGTLRTPTVIEIEELIEYRLGGLDFAIARLAGSPGTQWGVTRLADDDGNTGDMICIIGHPAGRPKRIEAGPLTAFQGDLVRYNDIDTLGGNSGSGILRASDGCIVGIHTNGGCNAAMTGSNFGVKITALRRESPTIQSINAHTNTFADQIATLASRDSNTFADRFTTIQWDRTTLSQLDSNTSADRITSFLADRFTGTVQDFRGTTSLLDQGGTPIKALDDRKSTGLDKLQSDRKLAGSDVPFRNHGGLFGAGIGGGAQPFVLSTPHHAQSAGNTGNISIEELSQIYEQTLAELEAAISSSSQQLEELQAQYNEVASEYSEVMGQS